MNKKFKNPLLAIICSSLVGCAAFTNDPGVSEEFISSLPVENYDSLSFDRVVSFYADHCESMFVAAPNELESGFGLNVLKFTRESGSFNSLEADSALYSENPHYIRYRNALNSYPDVALEEMQTALNNHKEWLQRLTEGTGYFVQQVNHRLQVDREKNNLVLIMDNTLRFEEGVDTLRNERQNDVFRSRYASHEGVRNLYQSQNNKQNKLYDNVFTHGTNNRVTLDAVFPRLESKVSSDSEVVNVETLSNSDTRIEFKLSPEMTQNIVEKQISENYVPVARLELLIEPSSCAQQSVSSYRGGHNYALSGDIVGIMITISDLGTEASTFVWYSEELI